MSARDRIIDAAERIARNDGRLSANSSADLDLAQDDFEEALAAYVGELVTQRTDEILAAGWDASIASARINEAVHIGEMAERIARGSVLAAAASKRRPGTLNRQVMRAPLIDVLTEMDDGAERYEHATDAGRFVETDIGQAHIINSTLITSEGEIAGVRGLGEKLHAPVLDIDFPAELVPSSTPGHFHLYLDRPILETDYFRLLDMLGEVGILESGYVAASKSRGYSSARLPWVRKGDGTLHSDRLPLTPAADPTGDGRPF